MKRAIAIVLVLAATACADKKTTPTPSADSRQQATDLQKVDVITSQEFAAKHPTFDKYWFRGLAELSSYELQQSRYGEVHDGKAVLVFVTEPFLPGPQVKYEFGPKDDAQQVLKLNNYRRFYTGVYPYTMMTSTFTPAKADGPTWKLTQSVQEWCGQVFAQMNLNEGQSGYDVTSFSYFQAEGDREFALESTTIEDDLWTRIRLGPDKLPTGKLQILPSVNFLRLMHKPWEIVEAEATLSAPGESTYPTQPVRTYSLTYPTYDRTLSIFFEDAFPHRIVGWEETSFPIFERDGGKPERLTTRGRLDRSILLDYWSRNSKDDRVWRDVLNLEDN